MLLSGAYLGGGLLCHVFTVFTESIGIVNSKKKGIDYTSLDVQFSTASISEEKKSSLFVMRLPIFSEALGFNLLSLYVNPALWLQSIFSLSTCDMSNLCGLQIHGSCFYFSVPLLVT